MILVTSPSEAEGKSTTVANLGVVLAKAGERVAIVSCDLRRPRIGAVLRTGRKSGPDHRVARSVPAGTALQAVPGVDGLSILPAGPRPSDPTAVLGSDRLAEVFEELRRTFDVVLVDSPPVLLFTDAVILAQAVDVTLLGGGSRPDAGQRPPSCDRGAVPRPCAPSLGVALERGRYRDWVQT